MSVDRYLLLETKEDYNKFINSEFKNPGAAWHWSILNGNPIDFGEANDSYPEELEGKLLTLENIIRLLNTLKATTSLEKENEVKKVLENSIGKVILFYTN